MLDAIIGQNAFKRMLTPLVAISTKYNEAMPNILLDWPPGTGKTHNLAVVAKALDLNHCRINMSIGLTEIRRQLFTFKSENPRGGLVGLDEVGESRKNVLPWLLDLLDPKIKSADGVNYRDFSFWGMTTDGWKMSDALDRRFGIYRPAFEKYEDDHIVAIMEFEIRRHELEPPTEILRQIVDSTSHQPSMAVSICEPIINMMKQGRSLTPEDIYFECQIAPDGLQAVHENYGNVLVKSFHTDPYTAVAGTLAKALNIHIRALPRIEALLERRGYLRSEPNYIRALTAKGIERFSSLI